MEREGTGDCDCDLVMELGNEVMSSPALTCSKLQREVWTQGSCDSDPPSLSALRGSGPRCSTVWILMTELEPWLWHQLPKEKLASFFLIWGSQFLHLSKSKTNWIIS